MTANEQGDLLLFLLNRANAGASFSYSDEKLSQALTQAQWHYVKSFIIGDRNRVGTSFEETEIRGQGLAPLIRQEKDVSEVDNDSMYPDSKRYQLPKDFMWTLDEYLLLTTKDCEEEISAEVRVVRHDEYSRYINNIYKKPRVNGVTARVWRMFYNSEELLEDEESLRIHELVLPKDTTSAKYSLRYLKLPTDISVNKTTPAAQVDCELADQTHVTITEIARDIMLDTVKEKKIQSLPGVEAVE
jgi:hypothetical protein